MDSKIDQLAATLSSLPGALVAFSGGVDSAFLAEMAHRALANRSLAVVADSYSLARSELRLAQEVGRSRGWAVRVIKTTELDDERYASNPTNRCYYCKAELMTQLAPIAAETGYPILLGTNIDDLADFRPGQAAATEAGALHPMVEAGLTKAEIREASRLLGLPTWDKPAAACLASRFRHGVRVTYAGLARVESAEAMLLDRGYRVVRVRDLGEDRALVEVDREEVQKILGERVEVLHLMQEAGFMHADIDTDGYRMGSMQSMLPLIAVSSGENDGTADGMAVGTDPAPFDGDVIKA